MKPTKKINLEISHCGKVHHFELRRGLGLQAIGKDASFLEFDCRKADCGICIVEVLAGEDHLSEKTGAESDFLRAMHAEPNERLACQCRVFGDVKLQIPDLNP